jgi:uncharacterized RDD family membrane protein YckC
VQRAQPTAHAATVGARIVASVIDWIVASLIGTAVVIAFWASGRESYRAVGLTFALGFLVYEVALTTWAGQTIGKRVVGMVVVDADNDYPNLSHSVVRYGVKTLFPLGLVPLTEGLRVALAAYPLAVLASIAFDRDRRGWHDHAAGTTVRWTTTRRSHTSRIAAAARPRPQPQPQDPPEPPTPADLLQTSAFGRYRKRRVRRR